MLSSELRLRKEDEVVGENGADRWNARNSNKASLRRNCMYEKRIEIYTVYDGRLGRARKAEIYG